MLNTFLAPVVEQIDNRNEIWFQLATHLLHIFSCCMKCLTRTSYPKDAHCPGHPDHLTYRLQISSFGVI